jgi:heme oxygenase
MDRPTSSLRAATQPQHELLDTMPCARALRDGTLPIAEYASFLHAVHTVHEALEQIVERTGDSGLQQLFGHSARRRGLLARDLAYLRVDLRAVDSAQLRALVLAQKLRLDARRDLHRLLGHAYVLEGSQLGGLLQARALASRAELAGGGRAYLEGAGKATQAAFEDFLERLSQHLGEAAALEQAIVGARTVFAGFAAILAAIPAGEAAGANRWLVSELNQDAGTHPIPGDLREVLAALRAGEHSYQQFAYYEARYGERGQRFTRSDSAWLATLARDDDTSALRQVSWLARILSARGMPRLLLEQHLEVLHSALVAHVPERAPSYAALARAAQQLRAERETALPEPRARSLQADFVAALACGPQRGIEPREAATLLVAAVADELAGIGGAVPALTAWLCDPASASAAWQAAAARLITAAREGR